MIEPQKRNLITRLAVAAVSIPVIIIITKCGGLPFLVFTSLAAFLGMLEFRKIAISNDAKIPEYFLAVLIVVTLWLVYNNLWEILAFVLLAGFSIIVSLQIFAPVPESGKGLAFSALGFLYLIQFTFWILIRQLPLASSQDYSLGGQWMISLFLIVWSCDTAAYFGGRSVGRYKLAPTISPNKTREGAVFGLVGAVLAAVIIRLFIFKSLSFLDLAAISILIGVIGQIGDLVESLLKRSGQLKDTSGLIPGHGGVLDRFDSLLFVSPWVYFYLRLFVF
ncbi:MAG: phosphatidate cytidylyltransferase [candidate division Zixibacteria bacterium]|nr:phosphatidate cytidylyltransferase [candidate division Zixibacteria bacterium]